MKNQYVKRFEYKDLTKSLKWISKNKEILNISQIERNLELSDGVIKRAINGIQLVPKKYHKKIDEYISEIRSIKKIK
ncbi:hypothetical protein P872_05205 [Rhodonellum psychrophilum GCM71 = DSM 17998]|uniref:Uncharacterized protein n=2 Tax=Rhodonellum TaxID=336827 RepID=U5C488_9BACT|nr:MULTISPECIES: hypothetical protein [Rhodonellum]ERM83012.1 hypothetical protein P872_05205 [Rhodonellum psychrophilum GCM71 = DSM 17998]SDZ35886.1 hypothetical protein SAMN05444412_11169 [Rhodonellum ikkaensis]